MRLVALFGVACAAAISLVDHGAAAPSAPLQFTRAASEIVVDVELVLAVDISYSMDYDELRIQREGYAEAIVSKEFLNALKIGPHGAVAITYIEWSSATDQRPIVPWTIIDGPESAAAVAAEILNSPLRRGSHTSISAAINFAMNAFEKNPYKGLKRVIDVSGDGPNNRGEPVQTAREAALAQGVTINGLPILIKPVSVATDIQDLDLYYEDCVIGGPGAFIVPIKDRREFKEAIRTKLVLEVAEQGQVFVPAQLRQPRVPCTIGEERWRDRFLR